MINANRIFACKAQCGTRQNLFAYGMLIGVWIYIIADGKVF